MKLDQRSISRQQAYLDGEPCSPLQAALFGVATIAVMFGPGAYDDAGDIHALLLFMVCNRLSE